MINPTEILAILQMNGLNKNSSLKDVEILLTQINYSEEDKLNVISTLKSQGWTLPEVVQPVETINPVAPNSIPSPDVIASAFASIPTESAVMPKPEPSISQPVYNKMPEQPIYAPSPEPVISTPPQPTPAPVMSEPVPERISMVQPQPEIQPNNVINMPVTPTKSGGAKTLIISIIVIIFVILLCGSISYAYINKVGPFSLSSYTEDNFALGMLTKIAQIDSASYTFSGALNVVPRDSDAVPFTIKISNEKELKQKYYYDSERIKNISGIISKLNSDAGYYSTGSTVKKITKPYPTNLNGLFAPTKYSTSYSIVDPETKNTYQYQAIEGGTNFNLTIEFATDDAIKAVNRYGYKSTSTIVEGKKVTFTKNSRDYLYLSSEPPKPYLTMMSESLSMLPSEVNAKIAFSASSDFKPQQMANWSFNLDAQGDFGDMTYKINADALRKDDNYYFKINNIPSFFLFNQLSVLKGKWIVVPSKTATSSTPSSDSSGLSYSPFSSIQNEIPAKEAEYKKSRDTFVRFIKKAAVVADEEKIFVFKNKPNTENVNGRSLVKYEIGLRKDKILSFYTRLQNEIKNDPELSDYVNYVDQGYIDYLKSDEFSQIFDYVDKNSKFTIWTDSQGYPAILQNVTRIVPSDEALQLKDNQINITLKLDISSINKPVEIQAPSDATSLDKITNDFKEAGLTGEAGLKGEAAAVKSELSSMRAQAELIYDQSLKSYGENTFKSGSYGKNPFTLGPCKLTVGTLFADDKFSKTLNKVTKDNPSIATCVSSGYVGNVSSWAVSAPIPGDDGFSWCVDSSGASVRIIDFLKGTSCR